MCSIRQKTITDGCLAKNCPTFGRWTLDAGRLTGDGRGLNGRRWMIFGFAHLPSSTASVEPISPRLRVYPQVARNGHIRFALRPWATAFYEQIHLVDVSQHLRHRHIQAFGDFVADFAVG